MTQLERTGVRRRVARKISGGRCWGQKGGVGYMERGYTYLLYSGNASHCILVVFFKVTDNREQGEGW